MRRLNGIDALMLYLDGGSAYNHTLKISVLDPVDGPRRLVVAEGPPDVRGARAPASRLPAAVPADAAGPASPDLGRGPRLRSRRARAPRRLSRSRRDGGVLRARRADLRPPAGSRPPAVADLGRRGPRRRPRRTRDAAAPCLLRRRRRAGHARLVLQRHARRCRGVPGPVGAAAAAVDKAAAGLGATRPARQTPQSRADRTGTARSGAHRARLRQRRRAARPVRFRPLHTAGPVPVRACRAADGSPARRSRSPTFAR